MSATLGVLISKWMLYLGILRRYESRGLQWRIDFYLGFKTSGTSRPHLSYHATRVQCCDVDWNGRSSSLAWLWSEQVITGKYPLHYILQLSPAYYFIPYVTLFCWSCSNFSRNSSSIALRDGDNSLCIYSQGYTFHHLRCRWWLTSECYKYSSIIVHASCNELHPRF